MSIINKDNFLFFNKKGDNMNFFYDSVDQIYKGNYVITDKTSVSVDLIESEQLIILEKVINENAGGFDYTKALSKTDNASLEFSFEDADEFFFYDIAAGDDGFFYINREDTASVPLIYSNEFVDATLNNKTYTEVPIAYDINSLKKDFTTVNIGFSASLPNSYIGKLLINITIDGVVEPLAEIFFFADVIAEDGRLPLLLNTLGHTLNNKDFLIFDSTNVKESEIDYNIINKKRKELLLEFHNIFPYLGGYKALINIIKFFGYENLTMKEYWKNVDISSEKYGYTKGVDIEAIFEGGDTNTGELEGLFPSKVYRKTNNFGLYYQITQETGEFDEDGIPIVEETSEFTVQEILIKLFALKEKLKQYFLPFNARIIDIVGEALYYTKIELNYWRDITKIDDISVNIDTTFDIVPSTHGFIEDLRPIYWAGTKIGNDLTLGGSSTLQVREFTLTDSFYDNTLRIFDDVSGVGVQITAEYKSDNNSNMSRLYAELLQVNEYPFNRYHINLKDNTILLVERESTDSNIISEVTQGRFSSNMPILDSVDFFNGTNAVSSYNEAYLGYFFDPDWTVFDLDNNEGIPVGYPVLLKNTSFDVTWEDMQMTWNTVDDKNNYTNFELPGDPGFPALLWNNGEDFTSGINWENAGQSNFYEIKWKITKEADETPAFESEIQGTLDDYNEWFQVLPYAGKYTVELSLYDLYGSISYRIKKDFIEVVQKNPDFTAWKIKDITAITWEDMDYTWEEFESTWELPFKPNTTWNDAIINWHSIDNVEFYQNLAKQEVEQNSLEDRNPYIWENLPDNISWEDADHLFWDEMNPTFTKFYIKNLGASGGSFTIIRENDLAEETFNFIPTGDTANIYVDFINEITKINSEDYPILTSFLWDYTRVNNPEIDFEDTIIAISKEYEKPKRYSLTGSYLDISEFNTPINGYGALGDAPCGFVIYEFNTPGATGDTKISIDDLVYSIPTGLTTLDDLNDDLNLNSPYDEWEFNIVKAALGATSTYDMKIIASKKYYEPNDECKVLYKNMFGTRQGRSITTNATWSSLDVLYYQSDLNKASQVFFAYDASKMPGYTNPTWEIYNETKGEVVIKYLNKYMSYLFTETGEYTIRLTLEDTNGNSKTIQKNGLIRII